MKKSFPLCLLFCLLSLACSAPLWALNFPVESGSVSRSFGLNEDGRPSLGMEFTVPAGSAVHAANDGEVLFESGRDGRLPTPEGSILAVDQGDGLISVYSGLKEGEDIYSQFVIAGQVLGHAREKNVGFSIYDRKESWWTNPLAVADSPAAQPSDEAAQKDAAQKQILDLGAAPVILSVTLHTQDGRSISPGSQQNIAQGHYTVEVNATLGRMAGPDVSPMARRIAAMNPMQGTVPYSITVMANGSSVGSLSLETISSRDGALMSYRQGLVPAAQVYAAAPALAAASLVLTRGVVEIDVIAEDKAGNQARAVYRLQVR